MTSEVIICNACITGKDFEIADSNKYLHLTQPTTKNYVSKRRIQKICNHA
jgi:hypothetical protein